ncbi:MAG: polysaccharide biosynthesis protein, partial [Armatimonadetes bacterium]|nr:polysaccharide biosynthesis protein [Armatimonadota bacterium]
MSGPSRSRRIILLPAGKAVNGAVRRSGTRLDIRRGAVAHATRAFWARWPGTVRAIAAGGGCRSPPPECADSHKVLPHQEGGAPRKPEEWTLALVLISAYRCATRCRAARFGGRQLVRQRISIYRVGLALADGALVGGALLLSTVAFYSGRVPPDEWQDLKVTVIVASLCLLATNALFGLYSRVWQYASADTAVAVGASVTLAMIAAAALDRLTQHPTVVPVWLTAWLATLMAVGAVRFAWRFVRPLLGTSALSSRHETKRVLVYGAGHVGHHLMADLRAQGNGHYDVVGLVDDDPAKLGAFVGRTKVLGNREAIAGLVAEHGVQELILAIPGIDRAELRSVHSVCRAAGIGMKVLPSLLESMESPETHRVRPIQVEDLLSRDVALSDIALEENYLEGKTVLVTGAGGSIGSELSRQVCRYGPRRVILLGRGENRIHWVYSYLKDQHPEIDIVPVVANVTVESSVEQLLRRFHPEIVIHAAAHKHVYLMEFVPVEAVRNNVLGTACLADLAERHGVERFVFISTDKAASPTNVMGATKRMAELTLARRPFTGTRFTCVRFGNVLGSAASVLEIFRRQWADGEPLTVTHPEATRYFMSIPEACFLVLQAGALCEHGDKFVLRMGEPVRILDLAREFISLQGGDPDASDAIRITELRPGERIHEALIGPGEDLLPTVCEYIDRINPNGNGDLWPELRRQIEDLRAYVEAEDDE